MQAALRRRRAIRVALCLVGGFLLLTPTAAAEKPAKADDCMSFAREEGDHSIDYRLGNGCERRVACTVSWTLRCGDAPKVTKYPDQRRTTLAPDQSSTITASASACGTKSWEIADVAWTCGSAG